MAQAVPTVCSSAGLKAGWSRGRTEPLWLWDPHTDSSLTTKPREP